MAGRLNTVAGRLILMLLLIHAVSLPVLFGALDAIVKRAITEAFVDEARIFSRVFADTLETILPGATDAEIVAHLDSAVLGGQNVYAAIEFDGRRLVSSVMSYEGGETFKEDFGFGENGDDTYYLAVPISARDDRGQLQLGLDEAPVRDHIEAVRATILYVLAGYVMVVVLAAALVSSSIVKPLRRLQEASRNIASGSFDRELRTDSTLLEIFDLYTDLEKMRRNLVGTNARLQAEIADRERSEAQRRALEQRLRHAQRLESLGTLAGGVAHEFNNVLQPIMLYTELALEDLRDSPQSAENLQRVKALSQRARGLSQQILTFGRRTEDWNATVNALVPVVEEGLTMIRALLPATVDLRAEIDRDIGAVRCDPAQIQQLLVNLCNNASRAIRDRDGYIRVALRRSAVEKSLARTHPDLPEGDYAVLEVADNGIGMDRETVERVFEPFFTTQPVGDGTGLGLSVVHGIVKRHRGDVIIESEPGKGTTVRVFLPIAMENSNDIDSGH